MIKKIKSIFVGVDGKPVKVWDEENGILDPVLYAYVVKRCRG